ncbi:MAG: hypothetical protein HRT69_13840 [Flavobacteriaceae bacterium]|nr:hypothetical protein [Flavobacteriaceae bacterium]
MSCGDIAADVIIDCDNPIKAGTENRMIVLNRTDWNNGAIGFSISNNQVVESIALATGKEGFVYEGKRNSITPKYELVKTKFSEDYKHEVSNKVFDLTIATKKELMAMAKGSFVVLVENKYKGATGEAAYEIYGVDAGLELSQNVREINNIETGGAFDIILSSNDEDLEKFMPKVLFKTDFATTKAVFESLLTAAV